MPLSAVPNTERPSKDEFRQVHYRGAGEILAIRHLINTTRSPQYPIDSEQIERIVAASTNPDCVVVMSAQNNVMTGLGVGEKHGDSVLLTDLVLNPGRQGSGARAKGIINEMVAAADAQVSAIVCTDAYIQFFTELYPDSQPVTFESDEGDMFMIFCKTTSNHVS